MTDQRDPIPDPDPHTARLARRERDAALRALSGRLAHDLRNPLAAIRAACGSLHDESEDDDHRYRLELTLAEVDRVLAMITDTVSAVSAPPAALAPVELRDAIDQAIGALRPIRPAVAKVRIRGADGLRCTLPQDGLPVAIYSLLDHLLSDTDPQGVDIEFMQQEGRILVRFMTPGTAPNEGNMTQHQPAVGRPGTSRNVNLLVADRFARDAGGRLTCATSDDGTDILILDLPHHA